jgi:dTDP-4-amino-4,6-dideoxygalactose transaminase
MTSLTWDRHRGHAWSYDVVAAGYNYRLDEMRAAIGRVQLGKLAANNERRRTLDALYCELLADVVPAIGLPYAAMVTTAAWGTVPACHIRPILLPEAADRRRFMEAMKMRGIQTSIHYPPIHHFSHYAEAGRMATLPVTETVGAREVTLPLYPALTAADIELVVAATAKSLAAALEPADAPLDSLSDVYASI